MLFYVLAIIFFFLLYLKIFLCLRGMNYLIHLAMLSAMAAWFGCLQLLKLRTINTIRHRLSELHTIYIETLTLFQSSCETVCFFECYREFFKQKLPFLLCGGSFITGQPPVLRVSLWTKCSLIRAVLFLNTFPELLFISYTKSKCI